MRVFESRHDDPGRADLAFEVERVAPLHHAPAIVRPTLHGINLLVQVLTILCHPQLAGVRIDVSTPGSPHAVRPGFWTGVRHIDEGIVLGHRVMLAFVDMFNIDAQDFGPQGVESLPDDIDVGVSCPVASGDIQVSIESEGDRRSVVAVRLPLDDRHC